VEVKVGIVAKFEVYVAHGHPVVGHVAWLNQAAARYAKGREAYRRRWETSSPWGERKEWRKLDG
jgi:hypothetical protein